MIGDYYIFNGALFDVTNQQEVSNTKKCTIAYEVFTLENNSAIFFDEHYERLLKSAELKSLDTASIPSKENLLAEVYKLVKANNFEKKNIRIDIGFVNHKLKNYSLYFVKSIFPTKHQYKNGVNVGLCHGERKVPNAKIANTSIRELANKKISDNNLFEVLLVNPDNLVTEGSRSNIFFVKNKTIYTAKTEKVLNGITRQKVIEIAEKLKFKVLETDIKLEDISEFESAFLTSTSMIVLPISNIGEVSFVVENELMEILHSSFLDSIM